MIPTETNAPEEEFSPGPHEHLCVGCGDEYECTQGACYMIYLRDCFFCWCKMIDDEELGGGENEKRK